MRFYFSFFPLKKLLKRKMQEKIFLLLLIYYSKIDAAENILNFFYAITVICLSFDGENAIFMQSRCHFL